MKYFSDIKEAHNTLCLDMGFDPYVNKKITKDMLKKHGYIVDPKIIENLKSENKCIKCGVFIPPEWDGTEYTQHDTCKTHRKLRYTCNSGHVWESTSE